MSIEVSCQSSSQSGYDFESAIETLSVIQHNVFTYEKNEFSFYCRVVIFFIFLTWVYKFLYLKSISGFGGSRNNSSQAVM